MLQFNQYKKSYGLDTVVSIPHLHLEKGIYWLKGDNGSGKTTLLKSIAGIIPFEGTITVNDTDIRKNRMPYKRQVNYAEAEPVYPSFLTGNDLLQFYRKTKGGFEKDSTALLYTFGVDKYINNKVSTYSSGMLKKLSLLLAFIGTPSLILLDEPLITLDTDAVGLLQNTIARYHQAGTSFLVTSHQEFSNPVFPAFNLLLKNTMLTTI